MEEKKKKSKLMIIIPIAIVILAIIGTIVFVSNKRIKLTSENYSDYLQIDITGGPGGKIPPYYGQPAYTYILCSVDVKGLSSNYIYEDVKVEVHFYTKEDFYVYNVTNSKFTKTDKTFNVDKTFVIECDSSGNMKAGQEHYYQRNMEGNNHNYILISDSDIIKDVKVTGTLKPIK